MGQHRNCPGRTEDWSRDRWTTAAQAPSPATCRSSLLERTGAPRNYPNRPANWEHRVRSTNFRTEAALQNLNFPASLTHRGRSKLAAHHRMYPVLKVRLIPVERCHRPIRRGNLARRCLEPPMQVERHHRTCRGHSERQCLGASASHLPQATRRPPRPKAYPMGFPRPEELAILPDLQGRQVQAGRELLQSHHRLPHHWTGARRTTGGWRRTEARLELAVGQGNLALRAAGHHLLAR